MAYTKIIVSTCNAHISLFSPVLPLHVFLWKFIKMFNKQQVSIEFLQNLFIRFHIRCTKHHSQDLRQFSLPKSKFYYIFFVDEFANNFGWYFCGKKCILLFFLNEHSFHVHAFLSSALAERKILSIYRIEFRVLANWYIFVDDVVGPLDENSDCK